MSRQKEVADLLKELRAAGYVVERGKRNHYKVYDDGVLITTVACSPSDARWLKNARSGIRKYGSKPLP